MYFECFSSISLGRLYPSGTLLADVLWIEVYVHKNLFCLLWVEGVVFATAVWPFLNLHCIGLGVVNRGLYKDRDWQVNISDFANVTQTNPCFI